MAQVDFNKSAQQIVSLVGGKENVQQVTHCVTRVRFALNNQSIASANKDAISKVEGVMQVVEAGGQFQVVIGPKVEKMYDAVVALVGNGTGEVPAEDEGKKEKLKVTDIIMKLVSGIMLPVMPGLIACGMVACLVNVLTMFGLSADGGTYKVLYGIGQTCMYFFPVLVGGSTAKFFGINEYVGNAIGACLIYPDIVAAASAGESTTFLGFLPLTYNNYTSTVFPAIAAVAFASVVYKFLKKHIPDVVSFVMIPFLTVLITVPVALLVIGPVVNAVSTVLSTVSLAIYNFSPILCGILLGATWLLFIVPLGLHWGFIAIFMNNFVTLGYEPIMGLLAGMCVLSGTLAAVGVRSKDKNIKAMAFSTAISNAFGVSEPGLYGIVLQHKETILTTAIAGAVTGIILAVFHTAIYTMGGTAGVFAFPMYINPDGTMGSLLGMVLSNVVGFVLAFVLTMVWNFDPDKVSA